MSLIITSVHSELEEIIFEKCNLQHSAETVPVCNKSATWQ